MLNRDGSATLCAADGLWSPVGRAAVPGRRVRSRRRGRAGLRPAIPTSTCSGTTRTRFASTCRRRLCATPRDEALLRRAIDLQRPAHTTLRAGAGRTAVSHRRAVDDRARQRHRRRRRPGRLPVPDRRRRAGSAAVSAARLRHHAGVRRGHAPGRGAQSWLTEECHEVRRGHRIGRLPDADARADPVLHGPPHDGARLPRRRRLSPVVPPPPQPGAARLGRRLRPRGRAALELGLPAATA